MWLVSHGSCLSVHMWVWDKEEGEHPASFHTFRKLRKQWREVSDVSGIWLTVSAIVFGLDFQLGIFRDKKGHFQH